MGITDEAVSSAKSKPGFRARQRVVSPGLRGKSCNEVATAFLAIVIAVQRLDTNEADIRVVVELREHFMSNPALQTMFASRVDVEPTISHNTITVILRRNAQYIRFKWLKFGDKFSLFVSSVIVSQYFYHDNLLHLSKKCLDRLIVAKYASLILFFVNLISY